MTQTKANTSPVKWLQILFSAGLLVSFFLPWVIWNNIEVSGYAMPSGGFFKASATVGGPENPFPQFSFSFYLFWLIPVLATMTIALVILKKKASLVAFVAGALSLSLLTVYFLFSRTLLDFGVGTKVSSMIKAGFYIQALAATFLIMTAFPVKRMVTKLLWLVIGPVFAYGAYIVGEKYIMSETHSATEDVRADYTITAVDLIREFAANDTAANNKYREKILAINGIVSQVETKLDSAVNIKFIDTTRHFLNFSLEKQDYLKTKKIKVGDNISLKGSCSGSDYSMILDSTSINFKRAILNLK